MARTVIFFGSDGSTGHKSRGPTPMPAWKFTREGQPWGLAIDGSLAPLGRNQAQGEALLHHRDGWTAIAFWDRTGDRRMNSNSVFLVNEIVTFDELVDRARREWPDLFNRFDFEVSQIEAPCKWEEKHRG